jgi:hypothetical protein
MVVWSTSRAVQEALLLWNDDGRVGHHPHDQSEQALASSDATFTLPRRTCV